MSNIIHADLYRVRKGAAMRNALIGLLVIIVIAAGIFALVKGGVFKSIIITRMGDTAIFEGERVSLEGDLMEMDEMIKTMPQNGAELTGMLSGESILALFILIATIAVVGADYSAGTFRNTLSYETNRAKVYFGKMAVNLILLLVLIVAYILFGVLVGGIALGFSGFSGAFFTNLLLVLALQLPVYLALTALAQCLVVCTQKSSIAIAIYMLFVLFYSGMLQFLAMLLPTESWIMRLDFLSGLKFAANYQSVPAADLVVPLVIAGCVLAGSTALGLARYCNADMH